MFLNVSYRDIWADSAKQQNTNHGLLPSTSLAIQPDAARGQQFPHAQSNYHGRYCIGTAACTSLTERNQRVIIQMEYPSGAVTELLLADAVPRRARRFIEGNMT